jgi:hypothetical protein
MSYREAFAFARQYGLISHGGLTISEFAQLYIDSLIIEKTSTHPKWMSLTRQCLNYLGWCHLLLRMAIKLDRSDALEMPQTPPENHHHHHLGTTSEPNDAPQPKPRVHLLKYMRR